MVVSHRRPQQKQPPIHLHKPVWAQQTTEVEDKSYATLQSNYIGNLIAEITRVLSNLPPQEYSVAWLQSTREIFTNSICI